MKNSAPKPDPRAELQAVLLHKKYIFLNTVALRKWRAEFREKVLIRAQAAHGAGPSESWQPAHFISNILPTVTPEFIACETSLLFLENTAEFIEAATEIEPLLAAVAALEKSEAAAAQEAAAAENIRRERVDAAKADAFAKIELQFAAA
jgi:hypothetical protein